MNKEWVKNITELLKFDDTSIKFDTSKVGPKFPWTPNTTVIEVFLMYWHPILPVLVEEINKLLPRTDTAHSGKKRKELKSAPFQIDEITLLTYMGIWYLIWSVINNQV